MSPDLGKGDEESGATPGFGTVEHGNGAESIEVCPVIDAELVNLDPNATAGEAGHAHAGGICNTACASKNKSKCKILLGSCGDHECRCFGICAKR